MKAAKWHLLAREAGVSDLSLDIMLSKLTKEQRVAAERLVDAYEGGRITEEEEQVATPPAPALGTDLTSAPEPGLDSGQPPSVKGAQP